MQPTAKELLHSPLSAMHIHPAFPVAYALVEALARILPQLRARDRALARALRAAVAAVPHQLAVARLAGPGPQAVRHMHRAYLRATEARRLLLEAESRRYLSPERPNPATVLAGMLVQHVSPTV